MSGWWKIAKLGQGSYASVFQACNESLSCVAVKSVDYNDHHGYASLEKEGQILAQLNGTPNVVQYFGEDFSIENGRGVYSLLLEYSPVGSFYDLMKNTYSQGQRFPETHIACYASMLLTGLAGIHSKGIVHCDLKPANILVFPAVYGGGLTSQLKLADFGVARRVSEKEPLLVYDSEGRMNYTRTSLPYASPESLRSGRHNTCTDIWSLGCIVADLITGKRVWKYKDDAELIDQILHGTIDLPGSFSNKDRVDFLRRCLARNLKERWSAQELLNHDFIVKNLKIMAEVHGVDLNGKQNQNPSQKNPFQRVSNMHLFTEPEEPQPQQQQKNPFERFPARPDQFSCEALVNNRLGV
ncbi:OLC1v1006763C1 [Oldenlandia corymbosa var. corymbosa]|uniref:OLC1v1006763C1 n=1 Tax=Oldenlandia corymbosa var. corymbosa TaxID=529605 RepID=A0AAV1DHS3_OLDCO|nr:OLC1v1006763C1 [Oldenlandia corymbosa var. corymbosa]